MNSQYGLEISLLVQRVMAHVGFQITTGVTALHIKARAEKEACEVSRSQELPRLETGFSSHEAFTYESEAPVSCLKLDLCN